MSKLESKSVTPGYHTDVLRALEEGVNTLVALCESEKFSKDTLVAEWTHSEGNARNAYLTKFTTGSFIAVDMRVVKMVVRIQRMQ